jgi:hypothetical protein
MPRWRVAGRVADLVAILTQSTNLSTNLSAIRLRLAGPQNALHRWIERAFDSTRMAAPL